MIQMSPKNLDSKLPSNLEKFYVWGIKALIFAIPFISFYIASSKEFPFIPIDMMFPFITGKNFAFRILVEAAAVLWLGLAVLSRQYRLRNSTMLLLVLAFTFIVGLADVLGVNPYNSLWSNYERMDGYLTILHLCLYFMIIKSVFKARKDWVIFFNIFVLVSVVVNSYILLQKFEYIETVGSDFRLAGTIGNSAFHAAYLLLVILINMILVFNVQRLWMRIVYLTAIGLDLLIIYYSATRGAILAIVIGIILFSLFYIFVKPKTSDDRLFRKIAASLLGGVLVLSIVFFAARNTDFIKQNKTFSRITQITMSDPTTQFRLIVWGMAWEGIKERPILGWGQENFPVVYSKHYNPELYGLEKWADRSHNIVLDWLVNAGFLGLFFYLSLFGAVFHILRSAQRSRLILRTEAVAVTAGLIAYFFQNLFVFDTINTYIIFFAFLAYIDSLESSGIEVENFRARDSGISKPFKLSPQATRRGGKVVSLSVALLALMIFSFTAYFIHYKPIRESQILHRIVNSSPDYTSYSTYLDDFKKALAYQAFGDTTARLLMLKVTNDIFYLQAFNEEGAKDFIKATAVELEKQVAANPGNLEQLMYLIGLINNIAAFNRSITERAEVYIKEAVRVSPKSQWVYFALADSYVFKNDYENAFQSMKKAVSLSPEKDEPQFKLALLAILTSRESVANKALEKVKEIRMARDSEVANGKKPVFLIRELQSLVEVSKDAKNFEVALRFCKEIITISPDNAYFRFEIANIYLLLGDKANAIREAKKAAEIDPSNFTEPVEKFVNEINSLH